MSGNKIDFTTMNMNYLPALAPSTTFDNSFALGNPFTFGNNNFLGGGFSPSPMLYSTGGLFPTNNTNFIMPEFSTFGNFDPFGISSMNFNIMNAINARQQQNVISQMFDNFMTMLNNYKMPELDFDFLNGTQTTQPAGKVTPAAKYGNYNQKATDLYKGTAEDLNKHLKGVLKGKGQVFIDLQKKYGVSAAFLAAVVNSESGGTSTAAKTKNNVAGIMDPKTGYKKQKEFNSVEECLEELACNLKNNYINQGRVTVSQIFEKYCPIGADNDPKNLNVNWGKNVSSKFDEYNRLA